MFVCLTFVLFVIRQEKGRYVNIVWPPVPDEPELPTASPLYFPPPSQVNPTTKDNQSDSSIVNGINVDNEVEYMAQNTCPKMSLCSEEVTTITDRRSAMECVETIAESLQTQMLVENIMKDRPKSPPPISEDIKVTTPENPRKASVSQTLCGRPCGTQNPCETCPLNRQSAELKRPNEFQQEAPKQISKCVENSIPKKWESQMVQALTVASDKPYDQKDPFSQIPSKHSRSAFASALSIAPREPFTPIPATTLEPVSLPEETEPYLPPEHPIVIEPKPPKPEKPDSPFVKALQTAPERPFTPVGSTGKKKKQPDPLFKDLPKPEEPLTMLAALTTAPERTFSPLVCDLVTVLPKNKEEEKPKPKPIQKPSNPTPKPFKPNVPIHFEPAEERERPPSSSFPPITDELKASYEYHADYSQVKSEISSQIIEQAHLHEEKSEIQVQESKHIEKVAKKEVIEKQAECTILKKPLDLVSSLHKPESLPHYQLSLDAPPVPMDFAERKNKPSQIPKLVTEGNPNSGHGAQRKPLTTLKPGDSNPEMLKASFKPVSEEHPPSTTFSPRPGSLTPSMINKPAPKIPHYQMNLVATEYLAPEINLFDPQSPAISRSPSPCPGGERSVSPFRSKSPRPKSPAAGPPPNPLKTGRAVSFKKEDKQKEEAKKSLQSFIPQHKQMMESYARNVQYESQLAAGEQIETVAEKQQMSLEQAQNLGLRQEHKKVYQEESLLKERGEKFQVNTAAIQGGSMTTAISEKSQMEQLQQLNKQQTQSVEKSADNSVQIQRKKTVTEEYEHTHKEKVIEIQKNATTTKTYPFQYTTGPAVDPPKISGHVTCPQPLAFSSNQSSEASTHLQSSQSQGIVGLRVTCPQPLASPFISGNPQKTIPPMPQTQQKPSVAPSTLLKSVKAPSSASNATPSSSQCKTRPNVSQPNTGSGGGRQAGAIGVAPKRGRGVLNVGGLIGARVPLCGHCHQNIRYSLMSGFPSVFSNN